MPTLTLSHKGYQRTIHYLHDSPEQPKKPALIWLCGYRSVMTGEKARALAHFANNQQHEFIRFDYSGLGQSGGDFAQGCLSIWLEEAFAVYQQLKSAPAIMVGSSMGAWLSLLLTQKLHELSPDKAPHALVLIAPAVDYTHSIIPKRLTQAQKNILNSEGAITLHSAYDDHGYPLYQNFLVDAQQHLLLNQQRSTQCPITIIHGAMDQEIPIALGKQIQNYYDHCSFTTIKDGNHRLSRPSDIAQILMAIKQLC